MNSIIFSTELIKETYIIGFIQTMQTRSYNKETKKCLQYLMVLLIEYNCRDAAETSNKDNHSSLTSSSSTTTKATISPLPTTIPLPTTTAPPTPTATIATATAQKKKKTAPPTTKSTTVTLTTTKVSDLLVG